MILYSECFFVTYVALYTNNNYCYYFLMHVQNVPTSRMLFVFSVSCAFCIETYSRCGAYLQLTLLLLSNT